MNRRRRRRKNKGRRISTGIASGTGPVCSDAGVAAAAKAAGYNVRVEAANEARAAGESAINGLAQRLGAKLESCAVGEVAEVFHSHTFSANARLAGRPDLAARTTASVGRPSAKADVEILAGRKVIDQAQLKYSRNPDYNAGRLSRPEYRGMQKVVPNDQVDKVRATAEQLKTRGRNPDKLPDYADTARRAEGQIVRDGVKSDPLDHASAKALNKAGRGGRATLPRVAKASVGKEVATAAGRAALGGAAAGAAVGLVVSGFSNARGYAKGECSAGKAAGAVLRDTSTCVADGAAKAAAGAALKATGAALGKSATSSALRSAGSAFGRSNAAFAVGAVAVDAVSGTYKLARGEMDATQLALNGRGVRQCGGWWLGGRSGGSRHRHCDTPRGRYRDRRSPRRFGRFASRGCGLSRHLPGLNRSRIC